MAEVLFKYLLLDSKYMDYGEFTEEEVTNFRTKLRPLMYNDRLTGYNIYPKFLGSDEKFVISYMHNRLLYNSSKLPEK